MNKTNMRLPSQAFINQKDKVVENAQHLKALHEAVGYSNDLSMSQWISWYTTALEFRPDLILELGRGRGNSTCVFNEVAQDLPGVQVVSFCMSTDWDEITVPLIRSVVAESWFQPLETLTVRIEEVDFDKYTRQAQRVLVLWDAHGYEVADCILSRLMPLIAAKDHFVIMHDISDIRHSSPQNSYNGMPFWRGQDSAFSGKTARLHLGWMDTMVDQVLPALDFTNRNGTDVISADHVVLEDLGSRTELLKELESGYPPGFFQTTNHWAYFTLNGLPGPFHFPKYLGTPQESNSAPPPAENPEEKLKKAQAQYKASSLYSALKKDQVHYNVSGRPSAITHLRIAMKFLLGRYNSFLE